MNKGILVLLSGGLDSATCLALAKNDYPDSEIVALTMYYGQKHEKEIASAKRIADYYGVRWLEYDLSFIFKDSNCSLLQRSNKEIKHISYEEQLKTESQVDTYVPFRNGVFLSIAASIAVDNQLDEIWYGAHSDDYAGSAYPDCSPEFVENIRNSIFDGTGHKVTLRCPLLFFNKSEVVSTGIELDVPFALTWSCYEGKDKPCGTCATCRDRLKAFEANGMIDPLMQEEE